MKIFGKYVAVEQVVIKTEEKKARGLDVSAMVTKDLVPVKVLFSSDDFDAGTTVFVRADVAAIPQNKSVLTLNGTKFVMLPIEVVVAYELPPGPITREA